MKNWFLVLFWGAFIFFLSHQPELKSGLADYWDFYLRKSVHILEYAILALLLIRALKEYQLTKGKILFLAVVLAVLYAFSDEYHQTFIQGRVGALADVLIDSFGVFLAVVLSVLRGGFIKNLAGQKENGKMRV